MFFLYWVEKLFPLLPVSASVDFWWTAFSDPSYASCVQWFLLSALGFVLCSNYGPILYYGGKAICSAGIAGSLACAVYHLIGKTASIIVFGILLAALIFYLYMRRNNATNLDELRYNQGKKYYEQALHTPDRTEALTLLKKSAARDFIPGCTGYGTLLCNSERPADRKKGLKLLMKAAKYESVASYNLAVLYLKGSIVPKDLSAAMRYAANARKLGDGQVDELVEKIRLASV